MTKKTKYCKSDSCQKLLVRGDGENSYNWSRRLYCEKGCRYNQTIKALRDVTAEKPEKQVESRRFRPEPVFTDIHNAIIYGRTT